MNFRLLVVAGILGLGLIVVFLFTSRTRYQEYLPGTCSGGLAAELRGSFKRGDSSMKGVPYYLRLEISVAVDQQAPTTLEAFLIGQSIQSANQVLRLTQVQTSKESRSVSSAPVFFLAENLNIPYQDYRLEFVQNQDDGGDRHILTSGHCFFKRKEHSEIRIPFWDVLMSV